MNSFSLLSDNLISWMIQVSVIAALGAVLPTLFRIRHPKSQLAFCYSILVVCILLPLIEQWQHPLLIATSGIVQTAPYIRLGTSWMVYVEWVIAAGMFVKMCWLAGGLWQIRRYRAEARMFPIPESIRQARALTLADARFGISRNVEGPATLGHVDPIILLPESFLSLDHDAQLSVVCHELLHVKRNDWLVTLIEEIIGVMFWFNPSIWLLLSQTKLSREQIVDSEVVALTAAPAPYVHALLVMSGAPGKLKIVPAASFLSDGHLPQRVRSLLTKHKGSPARLFVSYASIACLITVFAWCVAVWFPLIGEAQTAETAALKHLLPPTLVARSKPPATVVTQGSIFNVRVPAPPAAPEDNVFYFGELSLGSAAQDVRMLMQTPPHLAFPQPFGLLAGTGVRVFRPGERATPEEIARLQAALGDRTLIEVMQAEDGTVQRLTIQRRSSPNEVNTGSVHSGPWSAGDVSAEPAGATVATDGIH